jgi:hypothetical protein
LRILFILKENKSMEHDQEKRKKQYRIEMQRFEDLLAKLNCELYSSLRELEVLHSETTHVLNCLEPPPSR